LNRRRRTIEFAEMRALVSQKRESYRRKRAALILAKEVVVGPDEASSLRRNGWTKAGARRRRHRPRDRADARLHGCARWRL